MQHRQSFTLVILAAALAVIGLIAFGIRKNVMFPLQADSGRESGVDYFFEESNREDGPMDESPTEWRERTEKELQERQRAAAERFRARVQQSSKSRASRARTSAATSKSRFSPRGYGRF